MTKEKDPTRREFLLELAKRGAYLAPVITSFAVAPELLAAQAGSPPGKMMMGKGKGMMAPSAGAPSPSRATPPSEQHRPPGS